jgi:hypothetical protein
MIAVQLVLIYCVRTVERGRTMGQTALWMVDISPQSAISTSFFNFRYLIFLKAIQIIFPSFLSLNNLLYKAVPTQDATNPVRVFVLMNVQCSFLPSLYIILHFYPIDPTDLRKLRPEPHFLTLRVTKCPSGFGGLGFSVLASGTQVRGFKPGRSRRIFNGEKILSTPSFGMEVKPWAPCRRFAACKRIRNVPWKSAFRQNSRSLFPPISSNFRR